jgi:hypothetical protein
MGKLPRVWSPATNPLPSPWIAFSDFKNIKENDRNFKKNLPRRSCVTSSSFKEKLQNMNFKFFAIWRHLSVNWLWILHTISNKKMKIYLRKEKFTSDFNGVYRFFRTLKIKRKIGIF